MLEHFRPLAADPQRPLTYDEIPLVERQLVSTLGKANWEGSPCTLGGPHPSQDGLIVEHWDAAESIGPRKLGQLRQILSHPTPPT